MFQKRKGVGRDEKPLVIRAGGRASHVYFQLTMWKINIERDSTIA
jgi:transcription antitermination factor NusA-like protein